jgi:hypothetical protein
MSRRKQELLILVSFGVSVEVFLVSVVSIQESQQGSADKEHVVFAKDSALCSMVESLHAADSRNIDLTCVRICHPFQLQAIF